MFQIPVSRPFHLQYLVLSHGFVELPPFQWDREQRCFHAVIRTQGDRAFAVRMESIRDNLPGQVLKVTQAAGPRASRADLRILEERLRWCLRVDDDFTPFQRRCGKIGHLRWVKRFGLGPLLRNSDLFEEFAKILITTNVSWQGTKLMNRLLLEHLGTPVGSPRGKGGAYRAFPTAAAVAAKSERYLRDKIRVGYRAPYLKALAARFAAGRVDEAALTDPGRPTKDLAEELAAFKGFGPYAVNSLLISLGRYDRLILDSWIRRIAADRHFNGRRIHDAAILEVYAAWGPWAGLACWFECIYETWFRDELKR